MRSSAFVLCMFVLVLSPHNAIFGQENDEKTPEYGWKKELVGGLNLTQTSFDNWTQGGENTLSWQLNVTGNLVEDREGYNWAQALKLSYGRTKVGEDESRKSVDEIKFESVFTYKLGLYVNPYVSVTGETQLAAGFDYRQDPKVQISGFMDPGYFTQAAGLGYRPYADLKTRLGFGVKETITDEFPAPYADDPSTPEVEKTKVEYGLESVVDYRRKVSENVLLKSLLELFSNVKRFDEIDVKWDTILSAKVSEYVSVNLNVKLFYDKDLSSKRQLKQGLALGFTYTLL